jgi:glutamyl-tRNA synthetase
VTSLNAGPARLFLWNVEYVLPLPDKIREMNKPVRVRFAPSPTGALHIGGVRTALFNYLFARKNKGVFILRIEDTDQNRFVPGAEKYITDSLTWLGILPDEGPEMGGNAGPYRQSERKHLYADYAYQLVEQGDAYYAFDTPEELDAMRERVKESGEGNPMYNAATRMSMRNSLTLSPDEVQTLLDEGHPFVIRLRLPESGTVQVQDIIRGEVQFSYAEMDDKILLKGDGWPTYHLANVVDDHLMQISHVIRGEEWLPSTGHHVVLHERLGWKEQMPSFAHLPLILKPDGKGKLSKRDGTRLGIPVFPLSWIDPNPEDCFTGFREVGYEPEAVLNFLVMLGWNPGTEQEIFTLDELADLFTLERVSKGGARFDIEKARWFNQHYLRMRSPESIADSLVGAAPELASLDREYLQGVCQLMRDRVDTYRDILTEGSYFFGDPEKYDMDVLKKKWTDASAGILSDIAAFLQGLTQWERDAIELSVKNYLGERQWGIGQVFPLLRLAMAGSLQGPDLFAMIQWMGAAEAKRRMEKLTVLATNNLSGL